MADVIGPQNADDSIVIRCSCAGGCLVGFERWDDDGPEFTGELYTGLHPRSWRERLHGAWTCLCGRERVLSSVILNEETAAALGRFLLKGQSRG